MTDATQKVRRTLTGRVVSDKMQKTVTVLVENRVKHPIYGKVMTRSRKYHAHVDGDVTGAGDDVTGAGDLVEIEECRPIAKTKAWRVTRVVEKARVV